MSGIRKLAATIAVMVAILAAGSVLHAADSQNDPSSMMRGGMMDRGNGMMGMMGIMEHMSRMMSHCSAMMGGGSGHRPNEQWRKPSPGDKG
jgi:hypothetical protein